MLCARSIPTHETFSTQTFHLCHLILCISRSRMNLFLLLLVLLFTFLALLLAWFVISSCLGDEIRAHLSGRRQTFALTTYGLQYARVMGHGGNQAGWEQIEMEDMLNERAHGRDED